MPGFEFVRDRITTERLAAVEALLPIARDLECSVSQLAIAWCLANRSVSTVILGASREEQLQENLGALTAFARLTDGVVAEMNEIVGKG